MSLSLCRKRRTKESVNTSTVFTDNNGITPGNQLNALKNRGDELLSLPAERVTQEQEEAPTCSQAKRLKRSNERLSNTQAAQEALRCGKIKKIVLVNFMCHAHYCIEMHPRVNFMVGSNGSGKSAILAALVVGMGARARATNRSKSLHSLIKNGEDAARVEITISNEGPEAFKPECYGEQITIVRTITHTSSGYKIKDARGHIVSSKFDELKRIIDIHNIQVDNPAFVMNQDSSREFLKEMEPKKNYQLFLKATQLDSIQEQLHKCHYEYEDHRQRLKYIKEKLEHDQQNINDLVMEHQKILSFTQLKHEIGQKRLEYEWSLINQLEAEFAEIQETLAAAERDRDKLCQQSQRKNEIESERQVEIMQCQENVKAKRADYSQKNEFCQTISARLKEKAHICHGLKYDVENSKKKMAYLEVQIVDLKRNIAERSKAMGVEELRCRNDAELEELRKKQRDNRAMSETAKRDHDTFVEDKSQKEEEYNNVKQHIANFAHKIDNLKREITSLQANKKNHLSIYGEGMQTILDEITRYYRAGKFSQMPRGPIGSYIQVPEQKYRDVVENQIGGLLRGFIVNNTADRVKLNEILRQRSPNIRLSIVTAKFLSKVHDVRSGRVHPPPGTRLLFDVIKCQDPVVMNCLIDQIGIETILLTDTKKVAEHFTMQQEQVPQNLRKIIVATQPALEYFPDPKFRMYSLNIRQARFIQVNVDECISQLKSECEKTENEKQKLNEVLAESESKLRASLKHLKENQALLQRYKHEGTRLEQRIVDLQNYEYPDSNEIDILQKELADNERKLQDCAEKLAQKKREFTDAERQKQDVEFELQKHNKKLSAIQQEISANETKVNVLQLQLRSVMDSFHKYEEKKKCVEERIRTLEANKTIKENDLAIKIKAAQKRGERRHTERTAAEILDEIKLREAKLKQGGQLKEDPKKLEDEISRSKSTLAVDRSTFENLELVVKQLRQSQIKRGRFVKNFKGHMVTMLQYTFNNVLNKRRFTGSIDVDHKAQTMQISVVPRDNHIDDAVTNTRSLSGGERSYTTVAFLISLWACVDHPFFFLDEYDVFADEVNREYMTRLLKNEGQKRSNRQFVFLTPQDMSIETSDFVRIHRLAAPDRR